MNVSTESAPDLHEQSNVQPNHRVLNLMPSRHSTRAFLPKPVPRSVIEEVLTIAQHAPSNSNLQPWRTKILTGKALQRLSDALSSAFLSGAPTTTAPIPEPYRKYRSALGRQVYGPEGYNVPRSDEEKKLRMELRNYQFFDAPCALIVCMEKGLANVDILSIGMYVQTVCLLLAEQGIGSCAEASVAGYPQVMAQELGLGQDMMVLVGVAVGYEDSDHNINHIHSEREPMEHNVEFLDE